MKLRYGGIAAILTISLMLACMVVNVQAEVGQERLKKVETLKYTLYQAPGGKEDPFSVKFPIKLDEPGLISIDVEVGGGAIKGGGEPFRVWIVEAAGIDDEKTNKIEKRYIKKSDMFRTKKSIHHAVDAGELTRTKGEYVVLLSNLSTKSHAVGTIIITYPAREAEADPAGPRKRVKRD